MCECVCTQRHRGRHTQARSKQGHNGSHLLARLGGRVSGRCYYLLGRRHSFVEVLIEMPHRAVVDSGRCLSLSLSLSFLLFFIRFFHFLAFCCCCFEGHRARADSWNRCLAAIVLSRTTSSRKRLIAAFWLGFLSIFCRIFLEIYLLYLPSSGPRSFFLSCSLSLFLSFFLSFLLDDSFLVWSCGTISMDGIGETRLMLASSCSDLDCVDSS